MLTLTGNMASFISLRLENLPVEEATLFLVGNMASMVSPQMTLMGNMAIMVCLRLKALMA
jgi:hypothetical protein